MEYARTDHDLEMSSRLSELVIYDPLTGLQNRSALNELFARALGQANEHRHAVGVLYIDLNDFRAVNKLHGQAVGDVVISRIANRLRSICGEANTIVRMDGDEFLIVSESVERGTLDCTAQLVVNALREPYVLESGKTVRVSGSCGTAIFPADGSHHEELIAAAELALQQAKKTGADIVAFDAEMLKSEHKRLMLENDISLALERGELSIVFQPQTLGRFAVLRHWLGGNIPSSAPSHPPILSRPQKLQEPSAESAHSSCARHAGMPPPGQFR